MLDRIGTAHGEVRGASLSKLDGKGVLLLGGGDSGGYADLPNGLVATLKDVSLEGVGRRFRAVRILALTDAEIASSFRGGADPTFLAY